MSLRRLLSAHGRFGLAGLALLFVTFACTPQVEAFNESDWIRQVRRLVKRIRPSVVGVHFYEEVVVGEESAETTAVHERESVLGISGMVRNSRGLVMTLVPWGRPRTSQGDPAPIEVILHDGSTRRAEWVARDPETGLTLIKIIDPPKLIPVRFARKALAEGNLVIAVGNSGEYSLGPVSDTYRPARGGDFDFPRTIEASVAVADGDLGGMLARAADGLLVGMLAYTEKPSTSKERTRSGGNMSFAIPLDLLEKIIPELERNGRVIRGSIGAYCAFKTREEMAKIGLGGVGVWVQRVDPTGTGAKGGLQPGDVIVRVNKRHLRTNADLHWFRELVEYGDIGDELTVEVYRCTAEVRTYKILSVRVAERREILSGTVTDEPSPDDVKRKKPSEDEAEGS